RIRPVLCSTLFRYTTLFRSVQRSALGRTWKSVLRSESAKTFRFSRPDCYARGSFCCEPVRQQAGGGLNSRSGSAIACVERIIDRSEEHTSELQSRENLVCRL